MKAEAPSQPAVAERIDDQTWMLADTHFFHANIGRYCERPADWQALIIQNWQRLIQPDEVVFHLGDLALAGKAVVQELMAQLPGQIFMLRRSSVLVMYCWHRSQRVHKPTGTSFFFAAVLNRVSFCFLNQAMTATPPNQRAAKSRDPLKQQNRTSNRLSSASMQAGQNRS